MGHPKARKAASVRRLFSRTSDVLLAMALALVAVYLGCNVYPRVRFDRERIEVWATPRQIQVTGLYHYKNTSTVPAFLSLGLPFPVDAEHPRPSMYQISTATEDGRMLKEIDTTEHFGNVRFRVLLRPHEDKWVRVDYVQRTTVSNGTYILLTTRKWRRSLDRGDYILHLGPDLELQSTNYLPDKVGPDSNTYSFSKINFYPDADWKFAWRTSEANAYARSR